MSVESALDATGCATRGDDNMRDKDLYQQILGLQDPWKVVDVQLSRETNEVIVRVERDQATPLKCPKCSKEMPGYDSRPRRWRHLDTCQFTTILVADVPRGKCVDHGVHQIDVPWAEPGSQFTVLFERLVIDWAREASQTAVARMLGLSWHQVHGIMERAVRRGLERRQIGDAHLLGVDEKSFRKRHDYVTVVSCIEDGRVLYVGDERKRETLDKFYESLTEQERGEIYAVAMDMWKPYIDSTKTKVPAAAIVFDRFHVARHLTAAVDKVRRTENKALRQEGDDRLVGTRYDWLVNPDQKDLSWKRAFGELRKSELKTARAWAIKETARRLWGYVYEGAARNFFARWYGWAARSRLTPIKEAARTLKNHLDGIVAYIKYPITNALAEGLNSKIQWIKYTARGFRNRENFKTAILFHCGGLDLYPHKTP